MFYVDEVRGGRAWVQGETAEHLRRVLRVERGQQFEISDREHIYLAAVENLSKDAVEFVLAEELPPRRLGAQITVLAALVKFDRFEWVIEKCSELGVAELVPVVAARTDVGLDRAALKRHSRWSRICAESGQQCRRVRPMDIGRCVQFTDAVGRNSDVRLFLDEAGGKPLLRSVPYRFERVSLLLGPEGGWTDLEREHARSAGWTSVTLGESIMRAETAAVAAVSQVQGWWWSNWQE